MLSDLFYVILQKSFLKKLAKKRLLTELHLDVELFILNPPGKIPDDVRTFCAGW